jgi:hypothetical protein
MFEVALIMNEKRRQFLDPLETSAPKKAVKRKSKNQWENRVNIFLATADGKRTKEKHFK